MTAMLVSRFLLDLQAVNQKSLKLARDDPLHSSGMDNSDVDGRGIGSLDSVRFDVVGSLGASLAPCEHASDCLGNGEISEDDLGESGREDPIGLVQLLSQQECGARVRDDGSE